MIVAYDTLSCSLLNFLQDRPDLGLSNGTTVTYETKQGKLMLMTGKEAKKDEICICGIYIKTECQKQGIFTSLLKTAQSDDRINTIYVTSPVELTRKVLKRFNFQDNGSGEWKWNRTECKQATTRYDLLAYLTKYVRVHKDGITADLGFCTVFELTAKLVAPVYRGFGDCIVSITERKAHYALFDRFIKACDETKCSFKRTYGMGDSISKDQFNCLLHVLCEAGTKKEIAIPLSYEDGKTPISIMNDTQPAWEDYAPNLLRNWFPDDYPDLTAQEAKLSRKVCCSWHKLVPSQVKGLPCPEFPFPGVDSPQYAELCELLRQRQLKS